MTLGDFGIEYGQIIVVVIEINTGTYQSISELWEAYVRHNISVSWWAADMLQHVTLNPLHGHTRIKILSTYEIGFCEKALNTEIYDKAFAQGLQLLTHEEACLGRLQFLSQRKSEYVLTAMRPVNLTGGDPMVFNWERSLTLRLTAAFALPGQMIWNPETRWAFKLP